MRRTTRPVNPGSLKVFGFKAGVLTQIAAIQPGDGMQFGPRHLDFHPTQPWVYVSIESQTKLLCYKRDPATGLSRDPVFIKDTLLEPGKAVRQRPRHDPRPSQRPLSLPGQPRLLDLGFRGQEGVGRRREQHRGVGARPGDRRADLDPERRRTRHHDAHLRGRSERPHAGRSQHLPDAGAPMPPSSCCRPGFRCSASAPTASSISCASTTSKPATRSSSGAGWSRWLEAPVARRMG